MKHVVMTAFLLLLTAPAFAAPATTKPSPEIQAEQLEMDLQKLSPEERKMAEKMMDPKEQALMLCQATQIIGSHKGAEYQPGVDAYGRPVTPADGNAEPQYTVPDRIDIPLDVSVLHTVGIVDTPTPELEANAGTVSIFKDGRVIFGNKDKTATLQAYCNKHLGASQEQAR